MSELEQAIEDVRAQHVQRSCVPGKWRVWRENNDVKIEVFAYAGEELCSNEHALVRHNILGGNNGAY